MNEVGQFVKLLLFDVIVVNFTGIISVAMGIFTISFVGYMITSGKAVNPKAAILPMLVLTALFQKAGICTGIGYAE